MIVICDLVWEMWKIVKELIGLLGIGKEKVELLLGGVRCV